MKKKKKKMTPKQEMFVKEYLIDLNATKAARRAGYSKKTAEVIGHENLRKPQIQKEIQKAMDKRSRRLEISADRVLQERARIAFFDIRKLYNEDGSLKQIQDIDDDTAAAIHSILNGGRLETNEEGETVLHIFIKKVNTLSKDKSLEALEKHLGLYEKDHEQQGNADLKTKQEFMESLLESIRAAGGNVPKTP